MLCLYGETDGGRDGWMDGALEEDEGKSLNSEGRFKQKKEKTNS